MCIAQVMPEDLLIKTDNMGMDLGTTDAQTEWQYKLI